MVDFRNRYQTLEYFSIQTEICLKELIYVPNYTSTYNVMGTMLYSQALTAINLIYI